MGKRKMTKAQAAAARHEPTATAIARAKAREDNKVMQEQRRIAQKKASRIGPMQFILGIILVVIIVVMCAVFTIGPGMIIGG